MDINIEALEAAERVADDAEDDWYLPNSHLGGIRQQDKDYIAVAGPAVVLELVRRLRAAAVANTKMRKEIPIKGKMMTAVVQNGDRYVAFFDDGTSAESFDKIKLILIFKDRVKEDELRETEFRAAAAAGVTTLATVFHACHRELCHFEKDVSFEIINVMEIIGESMGLHAEDIYKRLKMIEDVDQMIAECNDLIVRHGLDADEARDILLADQKAAKPLQGAVMEYPEPTQAI